ncbi:MAG: hypothetical protein JG764_995 [Clostridiales bacterium]|nr:hypothetical protein [Clostridiales bacterium]
MMNYLLVLKAVFIALFMYLVIVSIKKTGLERFRMKQLKLTADRLLWNGKRKGYTGKIIDKIDISIQASNIQKYLPFMDISMFIITVMVISLLILFLGYRITGSLITSLFIGIMTGFLPGVALDILAAANTKKIRRLYLGFLNTFEGFFNISGDIIYAFERSADYTTEPLKSFIKSTVMKYRRSNLEFIDCLDDLEKQIRDREFGKFIKFTKLHLVYGGDYRMAIRKLIEQARRLESSRSIMAASALTGTIVISGVIILDLVSFISAYTMNPETAIVLRSTLTGQLIAVGNLLAVGAGVYMIASLNRG